MFCQMTKHFFTLHIISEECTKGNNMGYTTIKGSIKTTGNRKYRIDFTYMFWDEFGIHQKEDSLVTRAADKDEAKLVLDDFILSVNDQMGGNVVVKDFKIVRVWF